MMKKSRPKKDFLVDEMWTKAWFYWIASQIGSDRAVDVRRAIEGKQAGIGKDGQPDMNSKFPQYKKGIRCPGASLIAMAEAKVAGSGEMSSLVLWKVLRYPGKLGDAAIELVKGLEDRVRQLLLNPSGRQIMLTPIGLARLQKITTLDGLAGLLIFFRIADERDESLLRWTCAEAICKMLLVLGPLFGVLKIDEKIYDVFVYRFLYRAVHDGYGRVWSRYDYVSIYRGLHALAHLRKIGAKKRHSITHFALEVLRSLPKGNDLLPLVYPYLDCGPPTQSGSILMNTFHSRHHAAKNANKRAVDPSS